MKLPKRGEKGFTLIELLIVVAILGVLAAVVIPNVGRFIGRGKTEAAATELATIQGAVVSMMVDNGLSVLPDTYWVTTPTANMSLFPAPNAPFGIGNKYKDPSGGTYGGNDKIGFVLYQHDISADTLNSTLVNYLVTQVTKGMYVIVDASGTVNQTSTGY